MPHSSSLVVAVNRLGLPTDIKQRILSTNLVCDPPPPRSCGTLPQDGLQHLRRNAGDDEGVVDKYVRALLWCMVYFPGMYIPYHHLIGWAFGTQVTEGSDTVKDFRRNWGKKIRAAINALGLRVVGVDTQKKSVDGETCAGVRLTTSGNDFKVRVVNHQRNREAAALAGFLDSVSDSKILVEDCDDPLLRQELLEEKALIPLLHSDPVYRPLLEQAASSVSSSTRSREQDGDEELFENPWAEDA